MGKIIGWSIFGITTITLCFLGWRKWQKVKRDMKAFVESFAEVVEENDWTINDAGSYVSAEGKEIDPITLTNAAMQRFEEKMGRRQKEETKEEAGVKDADVIDIDSAAATS